MTSSSALCLRCHRMLALILRCTNSELLAALCLYCACAVLALCLRCAALCLR